MDEDRKQFYDEIIECLIEYGNKTRKEAEYLLVSSTIYDPKDDDKNLGILDHETPYYWAMHILHGHEDPKWFHDPKLWPPPKDYTDKYYKPK